jgi:hypothetical protein
VTFVAPSLPEGAHWGRTLMKAPANYLNDVVQHGCGVTGLDADDCWRRIREDVVRDFPPAAGVRRRVRHRRQHTRPGLGGPEHR